jgi:deoxyribonuclease I
MKTQNKMTIYWFMLLSIAYYSMLSAAYANGNSRIKNFQAAKKVITRIYSSHPRTFYCGCRYSDKKIDPGSCGFISRKKSQISKRIEWEHIVPAHAFGQNYKEWRIGHLLCKTKSGNNYKGRRCVAKIHTDFKRMEADLYNLVPAIGEVNRARSNYSMNLIAGEERRFGTCDIEIQNKRVEPAENIRGDIARIYLYMDWAYSGRGIISQKNRKLFQAWHFADPVDTWECERAMMISKVQGNKNPFVADFCNKMVMFAK